MQKFCVRLYISYLTREENLPLPRQSYIWKQIIHQLLTLFEKKFYRMKLKYEATTFMNLKNIHPIVHGKLLLQIFVLEYRLLSDYSTHLKKNLTVLNSSNTKLQYVWVSEESIQ